TAAGPHPSRAPAPHSLFVLEHDELRSRERPDAARTRMRAAKGTRGGGLPPRDFGRSTRRTSTRPSDRSGQALGRKDETGVPCWLLHRVLLLGSRRARKWLGSEPGAYSLRLLLV